MEACGAKIPADGGVQVLTFLHVKEICTLAQEAWKNTALGCELSKCLVADKRREYNHLLEEQGPPRKYCKMCLFLFSPFQNYPIPAGGLSWKQIMHRSLFGCVFLGASCEDCGIQSADLASSFPLQVR